MIAPATTLSSSMGAEPACRQLGVPRSSYYRAKRPKPAPARPIRTKPVRALSEAERSEVRMLLNGDRFCDASPRQVYATLLDEGRYVCHWRTMYRILGQHDEVRERPSSKKNSRNFLA